MKEAECYKCFVFPKLTLFCHILFTVDLRVILSCSARVPSAGCWVDADTGCCWCFWAIWLSRADTGVTALSLVPWPVPAIVHCPAQLSCHTAELSALSNTSAPFCWFIFNPDQYLWQANRVVFRRGSASMEWVICFMAVHGSTRWEGATAGQNCTKADKYKEHMAA